MTLRLNRLSLALASVTSLTLLTLSACGGGGGGAVPDANTTAVTTTVIDGALQNAVVCVDANSNGECDAGELQGKTDASGKVTLAIPNGDVGKYPLVAVVGTDAIDVDNGPVTEAFTLSTPAGNTGVVTPLTTLVHQTMDSQGMSLAEAEKSVQGATSINVSLFQDFTTAAAKAEAAAAGGSNPADMARMIVVTTQKQSGDLQGAIGADAIDGKKISKQDMSKALRKKMLELLPAMATALNDPATAALTGKAKENAVVGALGGSLMTVAALKTEVAINNQAGAPPEAYVATSGFSLTQLDFTDASNWLVRVNAASLAQATLDGSGMYRYVQRRARSEGGVIARWNANSQPRHQSNMFWSGTTWTSWPLNCESTSTVPDAQGNSVYVGCNNAWTGKSNRGASFDISGRTMASVLAEMTAAGHTNVKLANNAVLASATFPANSKLRYQTTTDTNLAVAYGVGSDSWVQLNPQAVGTPAACALNNPPNTVATTLEQVVATYVGVPCSYPADQISTSGGTYSSNGPVMAWGNTSISFGQIGTNPISATPTSYFTGNTRIRLAFTGGGSNEVTYYTCQERQVNGFTRNCVSTGVKGTYAIATLGDARVMTFTNPPAIASALSDSRVFVERGGKVFYGYQSKPKTTSNARLNTAAANALFVQLGMPQGDAEVPLALTPASYQGTWDTTDPAGPAGNGSVLVFNGNGTPACSDKPTGVSFSCSFTVTNPATGVFTGLNNSNGSVLAGTLNFLTGAGNGTYTVPSPGTFVATRR